MNETLPGDRRCRNCHQTYYFAGGWQREQHLRGLCAACKDVFIKLGIGTPRDVRNIQLEAPTGRQRRYA